MTSTDSAFQVGDEVEGPAASPPHELIHGRVTELLSTGSLGLDSGRVVDARGARLIHRRDFTRDELVALHNSIDAAELATGNAVIHINGRQLRALLAMAERSVSEETVRKLAKHFEVADATELDDDHDDDGETWYEFTEAAYDDLAAAATRLRQGGEGNG